MKKIRRHFSFLSCGVVCLLIIVCLLAACNSANDSELPTLTAAEISSYHEESEIGSAEEQYVSVKLLFSEAVRVETVMNQVGIKLADENIKREKIEVLPNEIEKELAFRIGVEKIRDGDLTITLGRQKVDALVPSGVSLSTAEKAPGYVISDVIGLFNIRCILWLKLSDGGMPVTDSLLKGADERDGAIAVHGHDYLIVDEYDIASDITEALTDHFGDRYIFTSDGKTVKAASKTNPEADLEIEVYSYTRITEAA